MNAIILSAGLGSRFNEITRNNHKALLPIGGIANIERTIQYLKEFGIEEIVIVVGHMGHLFEYLIEKYQVKLVLNDHFQDYNNLYSMVQALPYFNDSYVIDADVVLLDNIFATHEHSCYYTLQRVDSNEKDWCPRVVDGRVIAMDITDEYRPSMLGISYWNAMDTEKIKAAIQLKMHDKANYGNPKLYWDNIPIELFDRIDVRVNQIDEALVDEMDTVENYQDICAKFEVHKQNQHEVGYQ